MVTTHKESVHEVNQFFVRYVTKQMKELNFLVGCVILKQTSAKGNLITHKEPAHEGTHTL